MGAGHFKKTLIFKKAEPKQKFLRLMLGAQPDTEASTLLESVRSLRGMGDSKMTATQLARDELKEYVRCQAAPKEASRARP